MRLFSIGLTALLILSETARASDNDEQSASEDSDGSTDNENTGFVGVGSVSDDVKALKEVNAWDLLGRTPPDKSWDLGLQVSYGEIAYFRESRVYAGPSGGMGLRAAYGKHVGRSRYGLQMGLTVEGPVPIYMSTVAELLPSWDRIEKKLLIGFSIGPALMVHGGIDQDTVFTATGVAAVRMGLSQNWTRTGQRLFVVMEPRVRFVNGRPAYSLNVVVGQGKGH